MGKVDAESVRRASGKRKSNGSNHSSSSVGSVGSQHSDASNVSNTSMVSLTQFSAAMQPTPSWAAELPSSDTILATVLAYVTYFRQRDGDGLASIYATHATFKDPLYDTLQKDNNKDDIGDHWRALHTSKPDEVYKIEFIDVTISGDVAHWKVINNFNLKGRFIRNEIDCEARFNKDGKIVNQINRFSLSKFCKQAIPANMGTLAKKKIPLIGSLLMNYVKNVAQKEFRKFQAEFRKNTPFNCNLNFRDNFYPTGTLVEVAL